MPKTRLSTHYVARALDIDFSTSQLVTLDLEKLDSLCEWVKRREDFTTYRPETWSDPVFWNSEDSPRNRSQYFAIGNAINFRYWKLGNHGVTPSKGSKKGSEFKGSMYMWRCLRLCVENGNYPLLDAFFLANLTENEFDKIFSSDSGHNPLEISKQERISNLRDLGTKLLANWDSSFFNLIRASENSLIKFCRLSHAFIAYDDPIYKLTMVNAILHSGSGLTRFDSDLLPGIDYQLMKQLLRIGVILPGPALADSLRQKALLSQKEGYELRHISLYALVIISEKTGISGEILDNKFWWNRQKCLDDNPVCLDPATAAECPFYGVCDQLVHFTIPLEITRYY